MFSCLPKMIANIEETTLFPPHLCRALEFQRCAFEQLFFPFPSFAIRLLSHAQVAQDDRDGERAREGGQLVTYSARWGAYIFDVHRGWGKGTYSSS